MFCENCGSPLPDNTRFCEQCGAEQIAAKATGAPAGGGVPPPAPVRPGGGPGRPNPMRPAPQAADRPTGATAQAAAQLGAQVKESSRDAFGALFRILTDPVEGLESSFAALGIERGTAAGVALCIGFGLLIAIAVAIFLHGGHSSPGDTGGLLGGLNIPDLGGNLSSASSFSGGPLAILGMLGALISGAAGKVTFVGFMKVWLFTLILPVTMFVAALIIGKVLAAKGPVGGYFFTIGSSLAPFGLALVIGSFLGLGNIEIMLLLLLVAQCYLILMLFSGLTKLCGLSARAGAPSVPIILVLAAWLSKVVIVAVVSHGL